MGPAPDLTGRGEVTRHQSDDGVALAVLDGRGVENTRSKGSSGWWRRRAVGGLPLWLRGFVGFH